ncbi:MAG: hypothetical protein OJF62_001153 [Pseudolabrys sp.]|nr:hypothetical protein [Pseudolabrys sp.]
MHSFDEIARARAGQQSLQAHIRFRSRGARRFATGVAALLSCDGRGNPGFSNHNSRVAAMHLITILWGKSGTGCCLIAATFWLCLADQIGHDHRGANKLPGGR